ncbi:MAG: DinB family protein [Trueperaceae bacterium]
MKEFLEDFQTTLDTAKQRLESLSTEVINQSRAPGKWSRKEILGHLIDSAANNHQRFVRVPLTAGVALPGYHQNDWVSLQNYQDYNWSQLVSFWYAYNLHLLHVVKQIPAGALKNTFTLNGEALELEFVVRDYLDHMNHHLAQIFESQS